MNLLLHLFLCALLYTYTSQKTEELKQLLQSMWNELDQATSAKYEKMEAEDKTRYPTLSCSALILQHSII